MQLSRRLKAVADSVTKGNKVADIGCDHAYISIYLIQEGIAPSVLAMDINKGPLARAKENILARGYENKIETRLSNGLERMQAGEADTILLAGMGGVLMARILEDSREVVKKARELVLQPQSEIGQVRKYLHSIGYEIVSEEMLIDDGKYYVVIKSIQVDKVEKYEKEVYYLYGKYILEKGSDILRTYLEHEKNTREDVIETLRMHSGVKSLERLEEILKEIEYIDEAIAYCK